MMSASEGSITMASMAMDLATGLNRRAAVMSDFAFFAASWASDSGLLLGPRQRHPRQLQCRLHLSRS